MKSGRVVKQVPKTPPLTCIDRGNGATPVPNMLPRTLVASVARSASPEALSMHIHKANHSVSGPTGSHTPGAPGRSEPSRPSNVSPRRVNGTSPSMQPPPCAYVTAHTAPPARSELLTSASSRGLPTSRPPQGRCMQQEMPLHYAASERSSYADTSFADLERRMYDFVEQRLLEQHQRIQRDMLKNNNQLTALIEEGVSCKMNDLRAEFTQLRSEIEKTRSAGRFGSSVDPGQTPSFTVSLLEDARLDASMSKLEQEYRSLQESLQPMVTRLRSISGYNQGNGALVSSHDLVSLCTVVDETIKLKRIELQEQSKESAESTRATDSSDVPQLDSRSESKSPDGENSAAQKLPEPEAAQTPRFSRVPSCGAAQALALQDDFPAKQSVGSPAKQAEDAGSPSKAVSTLSASVSSTSKPQVGLGDIVSLGEGAPQEFRSCPAIVTKVAEAHCTVIVLDNKRQTGIGECWPGFHDVTLESDKLRIGTQVVINGMTGARTKHLNSLRGVVSEHPKEGHPLFIKKPNSPEPQLAVCVSFHDISAAKGRFALVEPRFLSKFDDLASQTTASLTKMVEALAQNIVADGAHNQSV